MTTNNRLCRSIIFVLTLALAAEAFYVNHFVEYESDPFFSSKYQGYYDPHEYELSHIETEPDFTHRVDYISPRDVNLNRGPLEKMSRNRRMADDEAADNEDFFDSYDHYFDHRFSADDEGNTEHYDHDHDIDHDLHDHEHLKRARKGKKSSKPVNEDIDDVSPAEYAYTVEFDPKEEYERIKTLSHKQRDQLKKNPSNCKQVYKENGESCYECTDPKSGDTSESCNYDEQAKPTKFAYASEKNFKSKKPLGEYFEEEDLKKDNSRKRRGGGGGAKKVKKTKKPPKSEQYNAEPESYEQNDGNYDDIDDTDNQNNNDDYDTESFFGNGGGGGSNNKKKNANNGAENYDDQAEVMEPYKHSFFFSAPTHEEQRQKSQDENTANPSYTYPSILGSQKDVDAALAEFKKRDWSSCTKVIEADLTCYKCKDADGVSHQECMFVSESNPQSSRVVYNGTRNYRQTPEGHDPLMVAAPLIEKPYMAEMRMEPSSNKRKTKKVVIVKKRKNDDFMNSDNDPEGSVVEKIKRTLTVTVTGDQKKDIK